MRSQQTSATNAQLQGSAQKAALQGNSQTSGLPQATSAGQTLAVAQASSGSTGQSLNLSQGAAGSNSVSGGMVAGGGSQATAGLSQANSAGPASSCQRKGTGVVQPLPVAAAQGVTVSQGSQTEMENAAAAAAKKAEADGSGQQTVGMNLTRTATPAPSQTLISSGKQQSCFHLCCCPLLLQFLGPAFSLNTAFLKPSRESFLSSLLISTLPVCPSSWSVTPQGDKGKTVVGFSIFCRKVVVAPVRARFWKSPGGSGRVLYSSLPVSGLLLCC